MGHPQPAFDFIRALPNAEVGDSVFVDWWVRTSLEVDKLDNLGEHPEAWNHGLTLPPVLTELSEEEFVSILPADDRLNLTAFAIGLGLEDIEYDPEKFSGAIYYLQGLEATIILFPKVIFSVADDEEESVRAINKILEKLEELGLAEFSDVSTQTGRIADFI